MGPSNHMGLVKAMRFLQLGAEEVKDIQSVRRTWCIISALKIKGVCVCINECGGPLGTESSPHLTARGIRNPDL